MRSGEAKNHLSIYRRHPLPDSDHFGASYEVTFAYHVLYIL